jgi:hypothetical protein
MQVSITQRLKSFAGVHVRRGMARVPARLPVRRALGAHGEDAVIARWLGRLGPVDQTCIDVAASDGVDQSNTFWLYRDGWRGLAVEGDPARFRALAAVHARTDDIDLVRTFVTPDNVRDLLRAHGIGREPGFLNLDIDGYDHFVLAALLEEFRPSLMCVEINEKIPPPLRFTVRYAPGYEYRGDHFFGQSLAQLVALTDRHEYDLVELNYNNAFLVPRERGLGAGLTAEQAYREGYADRPDRQKRFPYNAEVEPLLSLPPAEAADFVHRLFRDRSGEYLLEV